MDIWKTLQIIRNRKWTVLITAILACLAIMLSDRSPEARYRSTAELLFNSEKTSSGSNSALPVAPTSASWLGDVVILKELMLSQDFLAKHVIPLAHLQTSWSALRDQLDMKSLSGTADGGSGSGSGAVLVQILADDPDPKQAQVLCQTVADSLTQYIPQLMTREYEGNRQFIEQLVGEAKGQLDEAQSSILTWQDNHHALSAQDAYSEQTKSLAELEHERAMVAQKAAAAEIGSKLLNAYHEGDPPPLLAVQGSSEGHNNTISKLQESLIIERARLQAFRQTYQPDQPQLQNQEKEVSRLEGALQTAIKSTVASMRKDTETEMFELRGQMASLDASMAGMRSKMAVGREHLDFDKRARAIELWQKNYEELVSNLYRARIQEQNASRRGAITLLEAPVLGARVTTVVAKTFQKRLTIAISLSLLLGVAMALVMEYISRSMRVTANVEEVLELRVLGTVPRLPKEAIHEWRESKALMITGSSRTNGKSGVQTGSGVPK